MIKNSTKLAVSAAGYLSTLAAAGTVFAQGVGTVNAGTGWIDNIGNLISFALNIIMVVALLLVFLYLILGGIQWITSGGDKGKTEEARNKITAAVIGIIILAAAYALVQFVAYILGFGTFQEALNQIKPVGSSGS